MATENTLKNYRIRGARVAWAHKKPKTQRFTYPWPTIKRILWSLNRFSPIRVILLWQSCQKLHNPMKNQRVVTLVKYILFKLVGQTVCLRTKNFTILVHRFTQGNFKNSIRSAVGAFFSSLWPGVTCKFLARGR